MSNCNIKRFMPLAQPESLVMTLLTAVVAVLSALVLALALIGPAQAFSDGNADLHEAALALRESVTAPPARAQTRLVEMPEVAFSRSISLPAIWFSGSTSSAAPALIASRGMPKTTQVASFCTRL